LPETRQFFNEGAGIFDFGRLQETQLFYSRRIGLRGDGTPLPIVGGARLTGRAGRQQVGALLVRTGGTENATDFATRVKRDILGRGYVGAMLTGREASGAPLSLAGGLDINLPYIVRGQNLVFIGTTAWNRDSAGAPAANYSRVVVDYPNDFADLVMRYERVADGFEPDLGFVSQSGIQRFAGNLSWTPRPRRWGIRKLNFNFGNWDWVSQLNGALDNASYSFQPLGAEFESGDSFEIEVERNWDVPREDFEIFPGSVISAGRYAWNIVKFSVDGSGARAFVPEVGYSIGELYDGRGYSWGAELTWRRQPHIQLSGEYQHTKVTRSSQSFAASVARLRADYAFSPRVSTTLFGQYDNESERLSLNARMRWTRSPGSDLYVVWNSGWPAGLADGVPWGRPLRGGLVVKYVHYIRR
jgi:hypothetical protein